MKTNFLVLDWWIYVMETEYKLNCQINGTLYLTGARRSITGLDGYSHINLKRIVVMNSVEVYKNLYIIEKMLFYNNIVIFQKNCHISVTFILNIIVV